MEKAPQSPSGSISSIPLYEGPTMFYIAAVRPRKWDHDWLHGTCRHWISTNPLNVFCHWHHWRLYYTLRHEKMDFLLSVLCLCNLKGTRSGLKALFAPLSQNLCSSLKYYHWSITNPLFLLTVVYFMLACLVYAAQQSFEGSEYSNINKTEISTSSTVRKI